MDEKELTYEEKNKLAWRNVQRRWSLMTDEERCSIVLQIHNAPTSWIPKALIHSVYRWVIDGIMSERLIFPSMAERRRDEFRLVPPKGSEEAD